MNFTNTTNMTSSNNNMFPFSCASVWFGSSTSTFGIIKLDSVEESFRTSNKLDIDIQVDHSGSMMDKCNDGRTKMQHVNFAVGQIIRKTSESLAQATISVSSFDDKITKIVETQHLTPYSVEQIVIQSSNIEPRGGTNIKNVLETEVKHVESDDADRVFMLLSDGQDTTMCGHTKLIQLGADIDVNTHVVLFGVGNDHDSTLFKGIVNKRVSGHYRFVQNVEDISVVVSEILYGVLNKLLKRVVLTVSGGEIYCWVDNTWKSAIQIDDIVVGRKKTFNVRSPDPANFKVHIQATGFEHDILDFRMDQDLTYDMYRQRTMELLHESSCQNQRKQTAELKTRLKDMMIELKTYMDENQLRGDKRFQVLCDDIFMCHQTMGTTYGIMCASARQTSQGSQSIYNNVISTLHRQPHRQRSVMFSQDENEDEEYMPAIPILTRGVSHFINTMTEEEEKEEENIILKTRDIFVSIYEDEELDDSERSLPRMTRQINDDVINTHEMLASDDSPYSNLSELTFIRAVSIGHK